MAETEPEEPGSVVLRDVNTGIMRAIPADEANEDERKMAQVGAKERKAIFQHRKKGGEARAGALPRTMTAALANGTVNLMLLQILQQEVAPATAKEAIEVAKIANEIAMKAGGLANPKDLTPAERQIRQDEFIALMGKLEERAQEAGAQLDGALPAGEVPADADEEPNVWDLPDDEVREPIEG